jgi:outer membrane protein assembly factor BamB
LCWLRNNLTTLTLKDGKLLTTEHFRPDMEASVSAATPIKTDHGWFISAGYGVGASLWDVGSEGSLKKTWSADGAMDCHYATPVYREGHVYGFDGRQESGMTLRCIDTATGKPAWDSPRVKGGTLMLVQDKLLVVTESGELWIVRATPEKFEQLAAVQIMRAGHRSYPAYSNGVLYARDAEKTVAIRLTK